MPLRFHSITRKEPKTMWTPEDRVEITVPGRRALNRAKDAREQPDPDERPELVETQPPTDCRQCNESNSTLFEIAGAIAQFMEDHPNG